MPAMMLTYVIERLRGFGYDAIDDDMLMLDQLCQKVRQDILNYCNIPEIPIELHYRYIDAVAGEFLGIKLLNGELPNIKEVAQSISSIKEGDTQINYGDNAQYEKIMFDSLNNLKLKESELNKFRCLSW